MKMSKLILALGMVLSPLVFAQPGPGHRPRPPHERPDRTPNLGAVIVQMVDQIMVRVHPSTSRRVEELNQVRADIEQCQLMRIEYLERCYAEKTTQFIQLAFEPEYPSFGSCTLTSDAGSNALWAGDGQNFAMIPSTKKTCDTMGAGSRFEKLHKDRVQFHAYNGAYYEGYQIRMTSGACTGAIGYLLYVHVEKSCR